MKLRADQGGTMSHYLKTFFMMYFLLITFVSDSLAQDTNSSETISALNTGDSDVCFDLIVDVRPFDHQIRNIFDSDDGPEGYLIDIPENRIGLERLELVFSVRRPGSSVTLDIIGLGESRNFVSRDISDIVQEAVRDGYVRLRDTLRFEPRQPRSEVNVVRGDRVLVPLGRSDHIQEGDVFHIYPRDDYYNTCSDVSYSPLSALAIARVVEIDDNESILEMNIIPDGGRSVQVGDIVRLSPAIDFASRLQTNTGFGTRSVLQFNIPRIYVVRDTGNRKIWTKITRFIDGSLNEAPNFGFQVVTNVQ